MFIYLENIPTKINLDTIKQFNIDTIQQKNLYSTEGIFYISNNIMKKLCIVDDNFSIITINNIPLICDNTKIYYNYPNKLPFHFKEENITINKYALRKNSIITFNIETINNTIINVYFTTKEPNIEHYSIQEDIIFFLNTF